VLALQIGPIHPVLVEVDDGACGLLAHVAPVSALDPDLCTAHWRTMQNTGNWVLALLEQTSHGLTRGLGHL